MEIHAKETPANRNILRHPDWPPSCNSLWTFASYTRHELRTFESRSAASSPVLNFCAQCPTLAITAAGIIGDQPLLDSTGSSLCHVLSDDRPGTSTSLKFHGYTVESQKESTFREHKVSRICSMIMANGLGKDDVANLTAGESIKDVLNFWKWCQCSLHALSNIISEDS